MTEYCTVADISEWYDPESYRDVQNFSKTDWFVALTSRKSARGFDEHFLRSFFTDDQRWDWYQNQAVCSKRKAESLVGHYTDPLVSDIGEPLEEVDSSLVFDTDLFHPTGECRVLLVDPRASDPALISAFSEWLMSIRKIHPYPISIPGKKALNAHFNEHHFKKWQSYHVLECFDLDMWATIHGMKMLPHERLCGLFMGEMYTGNSKFWGVEARKSAKKAVNAATALGF
ncbi:DUF6387 family protein [Parasedimentitalea psychrophila]|uniref:DUF6387 family protein n=1 Tax=Parasedimentitalea psychrophila TaxID=2997337 RepID=A0A9Y2P080_9RHOB|nr:DUF6387 family protein [Parasedimentitalea psychrophila]WIY24331.1 DUF6387 family protein [Parasedimentitalea psychrophila]